MSRAKGFGRMQVKARLVVVTLTAGLLGACAHERAAQTNGTLPLVAPGPANGLWAVLEPGCRQPTGPDARLWPSCASAVWLSGGEATVVRTLTDPRGRLRVRSYRARYELAAGDPLIARIGNGADGALFVALGDVARDGNGRVIAAEAAPVACIDGARGREFPVTATRAGCEAVSIASLRDAAKLSLEDASRRMRLAWIAPGFPS